MGCFGSKGDVHKPISIATASDLKINARNFVVQRGGKVRDDYIVGQKLGEGSFGYVRLATHKLSGQKRAVKTVKKANITKDLRERAKFVAEIDILKRLDHPNIVKLYEFYEDEYNYHLVTEYLQGGELFDFIIKSKMLSEPLAASFMWQLFGAVAYCHSNSIVHRDLKPENLLLDSKLTNPNIKVIDFGTSGLIEANKKMKQRYGTSYYIAPEVIGGNYNEKCDVWSCGVILYILLCGKPPFYGKEDEEIFRRIKISEYSFDGPEWETVSEAAKNFIRRLLNKNPATRISASEALQDPWLVQNAHRNPLEAEIRANTLSQLQSFRAEQKLQNAVLSFIASQLVNKEEKQKLTETFRELDKNGDGRLSREELLNGYLSLGEGAAVIEVERIMRDVDVDGSGFIDYTEFIMATMQQEALLSRKNLEAAFSAFDQDKSGKITLDELKVLLGSGFESKNTMWEELIQEVDLDGDGEIDLNEFQAMMFKHFA
mmetsp:Transcript_34183/g.59790  ORF Transcript_34183/g.59790 Transcript_34183/m.59790 type:complete len:487 (-) Transcript_34183:4193-5653(-)